MSIDLKTISKNTASPPRVIIYGKHGIGKTTFAASAEKPIFILTEDGLGDIPAEKFPLASTYEDVMDALAALGSSEHDYKTVVIDSLDWFEPLVWKATCARIGATSIESPGYGKGYVEADQEWKEFFKYVTALRDHKGMTVIMLAHGTITKIEDPMLPAYDMHGLKLHKRASAWAGEYSDIIGFATTVTVVTSEKKGGFDKNETRNRALTTGKRVLYLTPTPAYVAKNRYHMPSEVGLDWSEFVKQLPALNVKAKKEKQS